MSDLLGQKGNIFLFYLKMGGRKPKIFNPNNLPPEITLDKGEYSECPETGTSIELQQAISEVIRKYIKDNYDFPEPYVDKVIDALTPRIEELAKRYPNLAQEARRAVAEGETIKFTPVQTGMIIALATTFFAKDKAAGLGSDVADTLSEGLNSARNWLADCIKPKK